MSAPSSLNIVTVQFDPLIFYFSIALCDYFSLLSNLWVFNTFSSFNFGLRSETHTLPVYWILCLRITLRLDIILRVCCHYYLTFFSSHCANIFTDLLDLIIKGFLFLQISDFVSVSLWLEVKSFFIIKCLPFLSNLLHNLQCTHFWMGLYNKRTGFLNKNHVSWKTFFRFFQKIAVRLKRPKFFLISLFVTLCSFFISLSVFFGQKFPALSDLFYNFGDFCHGITLQDLCTFLKKDIL